MTKCCFTSIHSKGALSHTIEGVIESGAVWPGQEPPWHTIANRQACKRASCCIGCIPLAQELLKFNQNNISSNCKILYYLTDPVFVKVLHYSYFRTSRDRGPPCPWGWTTTKNYHNCGRDMDAQK